MIGQTVDSVAVELIFFGLEQEGEAGDVLVKFVSGSTFAFMCAGDGSVEVKAQATSVAPAPHTVTIERPVPRIRGTLRSVRKGVHDFELRIGDETLGLTNSDDQFEIFVNGQRLNSDFCRR